MRVRDTPRAEAGVRANCHKHTFGTGFEIALVSHAEVQIFPAEFHPLPPPACPNVLQREVEFLRDPRHLADGSFGELQVDALGR